MHTLDSFIASYMRSRRSLGIYGPKSQRVVTPRLRTLSHSFGNRPISALTTAAIERWLGTLDHLATNSKACYLVSVRQFTAWLCAEHHITSDPCLPIAAISRVKPTPRAQSSDAIAATLAACATDRERAVIWLMVGLGLRRKEVAGLRWEHYDPRAMLLEVRDGKNGKERTLPVTAEVVAALARIQVGSGPVIRSCRDQHRALTAERVGYMASQILRRAGVKRAPYDGVSGHCLRHTCASDVLDNSGDLRTVQQMLGHEHLTSTAIYLRRQSAHQMRAAMGGRAYRAEPTEAA